VTVKHAHQTVLPNNAAKDVSATHWNADHDVTGLLANPVIETLTIQQPDPDEVSLIVQPPVGNVDGAFDVLYVMAEGGSYPMLTYDATGGLQLRGPLDQSDGGAGLVVMKSDQSQVFRVIADNGSGFARVNILGHTAGGGFSFWDDSGTVSMGMFGASPAQQTTLPNNATIQDLATAIGSLGIVAPGPTMAIAANVPLVEPEVEPADFAVNAVITALIAAGLMAP
jgi:hypothetical protein